MISAIASLTVVQGIALVINVVLIVIVLKYGKAKYRNAFSLFLAVSLFCSIASLITNMTLSFEQAVFWGKAVPVLTLATAIFYAYFIATFTNYPKNARIIILGGAAVTILLLTASVLGYVTKGLTLLDSGMIRREYGGWYNYVVICSFIFIFNAAYLLWKKRSGSDDIEERNQISYLLMGLGLILAFSIILQIISVRDFTIDHVGYVINAIVLTYLMVRDHPADFRLSVKSAVIIGGVAFFLFDFFMILHNILNPVFQTYLTREQYLAIVLALAFALALVFNPLRRVLEEYADHLLYGRRYNYRQIVLTFAHKMNRITETPDLSEAMLKPLASALGSSQVSLLLNAEGYYQTLYAERKNQEEPVVSMSFREDGPIIKWLEREDGPLNLGTINSLPEFQELWKQERDFLEAAHVDLLYPIKTRQKLVAVLGVSQKQPFSMYSQDDIDLIRTISGEAAVVIENALLYAEAKERANIDELTGLFNHRYFHECLEREIDRSSRFGSIFSLIVIDIDGFKKYNDIYGHLAGDEVLRQTGKLIKRVGRKVDMAFRYGGDEFSILLPETPVQGAKKLGEMLRLEMETSTSTLGMPISCSLGVGSWPADGMTREDIIQSVDTALYYAKQNGKNRACLACEVAAADILAENSQSQRKIQGANIDAIYALAATVDAKDSYTYGHSKKVSKYALHIAEAIGYYPESLERIRTSGLLHDIGKIGISDNILNKPGYLTPEDFEPIRAHPDKGVAILKNVDSLKDCLPGVRYHHEHYDGNGYPDGLKGEEIPLDARILAVADAYDAMTSRRPYRQYKASQDQAIEELQRCAGTQFDPKIVHVFVNLLKNEPQRSKSLVEVEA